MNGSQFPDLYINRYDIEHRLPPPPYPKHSSQSGKSHVSLSFAERWNTWCTNDSLTSIIYLGEHISDFFRAQIQSVANRLAIPAYICSPRGVLNERFARSWKAKLRESGHVTSSSNEGARRNSGEGNLSQGTKDDDAAAKEHSSEEEDDEEEEMDDDEKPPEKGIGRKRSVDKDECHSFVEKYLKGRPTPSKRRARKSSTLSSYPKIKGKPARFFSLTDGDLRHKSFVATSRHSPASSPLEGGRAVTRSLAKLSTNNNNNNDNNDNNNNDDNDNNNNNNSNNNNNTDHLKETPNDSSFKQEYERRLLNSSSNEHASDIFPILANSLLIIDDALTCTGDAFERLNKKKEIQEEYIEKALFIKVRILSLHFWPS